jgi:hypothetical protein
MSRDELMAHIRQLPIEERLDLIEQIEDEIGPDEIDHDPGPVPDWHIEELEDRLNDPNEVANIPWDEVRKDLGFPPR